MSSSSLDIRNLSQTQLVRLLNSTPLGAVVNAPKVNRQLNEAGLRITSSSDARRINLIKYTGWLAKRYDAPKPEGRSYDEKLKRDLDRQLERSRQGRDIGPIPQIVDESRRLRCSEEGEGFRAFCETYFAQAFNLDWSDDHLRVIEKIERAVLEGGLFAFAMPRGSGKTTLARVAGLWAILYGYREYVCLIGSAEDQAKMMLEAIKREMLSNQLLLEDFPEVIYPIQKLENNARKQIGQLCAGEPTYITWSSDKLVLPTINGSLSSGSIITVAGLDSNIRGQQHTKMNGNIIRPSLVILDDPQTRQSAASASQTRHRLAILNGDVLGMAGPNVKIAGFMTCTKIYHEDLADQILDREANPEWQGECTKMVYQFPSSEKSQKLWDQYKQLRSEGLRSGDGGKDATAFYRKHQEDMDEGAQVAWPERYNDDEISALQHAMNLKFRDEEAFFAEYQNEPMADQGEEELLTPDVVCSRFNGRQRGQVPQSATWVTMFIDVHDKLLYYVVAAWEPDFTGYVIDYGTYPDQKRKYFTMRESTKTLCQASKGAGTEGAIQAGLETLVNQMLKKDWERAGSGALKVERCLIDGGYLPAIVGNVCHKAGAVVMPSKGVGIRAGNKPMSSYRRKRGERHGNHLYIPNVSKTNDFPHVQYDTNYWKTFVQSRLSSLPGEKGSMTLWGKTNLQHQLFADHVANSEYSVVTEGHGRIVREWRIKPGRPDNHYFDCLVGCAVAASMCGASMEAEKRPVQRRVPKRDRVQKLRM